MAEVKYSKELEIQIKKPSDTPKKLNSVQNASTPKKKKIKLAVGIGFVRLIR